MGRRARHQRVKTHHTKSVSEWADVLGVHKNTIMRWITHDGLSAIKDCKPWLIRGVELKAFLEGRKRKAVISPGEILCFRCGRGREPAGGMLEYQQSSRGAGLLRAICPICERMMCRAIREADIAVKFPDCDVTIARHPDTLNEADVPQRNGVFDGIGLAEPKTTENVSDNPEKLP